MLVFYCKYLEIILNLWIYVCPWKAQKKIIAYVIIAFEDSFNAFSNLTYPRM